MKAVIYARYSSDNQREASIEGQLRECMEFATYNDIQVIDNYIDRAMSAKTDNRPEFQRMIKDSISMLSIALSCGNSIVSLVTVTTARIIKPFSKRTA